MALFYAIPEHIRGVIISAFGDQTTAQIVMRALELLWQLDGKVLIFGDHVTVTAEDIVVTQLDSLDYVICQPIGGLESGFNCVTANVGDQAGAPASGSFTLNSWGCDGDGTPIAGTTFGKHIKYIALGEKLPVPS